MSKAKIFYWDACIYLAWIKNEEAIYGKERMDAIHKILKDNFDKNAVIITSTLTIVEVLSADLTSDQEELFPQVFSALGSYSIRSRSAHSVKGPRFSQALHGSPERQETRNARCHSSGDGGYLFR